MHNFFNSNYVCASWEKKVGIHYFHCYLRSGTTNCFVVRIPSANPVLAKVIGKYATKAEAEKVFLEHVPNWKGEIPYYEILSDKHIKSYK